MLQYGDTPLHTAARYGHAGVTRILISAKCRINEQNKNGDTSLHIGAALKRRKIAKLLVEANISIGLKNKVGAARALLPAALLAAAPVAAAKLRLQLKPFTFYHCLKQLTQSHVSCENGLFSKHVAVLNCEWVIWHNPAQLVVFLCS